MLQLLLQTDACWGSSFLLFDVFLHDRSFKCFSIYIIHVTIWFRFRGFGLDEDNTKDTVQRMADKAKDAASKTTNTVNSVAEGNNFLLSPF